MLYHEHPHQGEPLAGRRLEMGEKVQKGDCYASTDGTWKPPGQSVGITIETPNVIWVRPAPKADPDQRRIAYTASLAMK
jgi:hypothetical protein